MGGRTGAGGKSKGTDGQGADVAKSAPKDTSKGKGAKKTKGKKAQQKDCKDSKISKKRYKKLRRKTPSAGKRDEMAAINPKICSACGQTVSALQADHTVPMKSITQMRGFACLEEKEQLKVLNMDSNFKPMCGPCNGSKSAKLWNEWNGHSKKGLRQGIKGAMVKDSAAQTKALADKINSFLK